VIYSLVVAVGDLIVMAQVYERESLMIVDRQGREPVEPGDGFRAHQSVISEGYPERPAALRALACAFIVSF
jgi:hypothetical protein